MRIFITQNDMLLMKYRTLAHYVHFVCHDVIFTQFNYPNTNNMYCFCVFSSLSECVRLIGFRFGSRFKNNSHLNKVIESYMFISFTFGTLWIIWINWWYHPWLFVIRLMWRRVNKKMCQIVYWNNVWIGHLLYVWLPGKLFGNCFLVVHLWLMKKNEKKNNRLVSNTHTCNGRRWRRQQKCI